MLTLEHSKFHCSTHMCAPFDHLSMGRNENGMLSCNNYIVIDTFANLASEIVFIHIVTYVVLLTFGF